MADIPTYRLMKLLVENKNLAGVTYERTDDFFWLITIFRYGISGKKTFVCQGCDKDLEKAEILTEESLKKFFAGAR